MRRRILLATSVLVAGVAFSGCITQTGFHWSDAKPKKGEATKGILELRGLDETASFRGGAGDEAYFYVQIAAEGDGFKLKSFKFDTTETLGNTKEMVEDSDLAVQADECGPVSEGSIWRTKQPVAFSPVDKLLEATFKAKMSDEGGGFGGFVSSGQWIDDGDKIPEPTDTSDDEYSCSGFASTFVGTKGFTAGPALTSRLP